ncbi:MAG: hypothetical protein M0R76_05805 [Proteobacteria bacterium]|nr:hypothetical protein [Pseudomonadota bacterium]
MKRTVFFSIALLSMVLVGAGCSNSEKGGASSPAAVKKALENPTGSVDSPETAQGVADAFAEQMASQSMVGGSNQSIPCPDGGSMNVSASSEENVNFSYRNCCYEAQCCLNGNGWISYGGAGSAYELCAAFNVDINCYEDIGDLNLQYCLGDSGDMWFVVSYQGETFAVSGYYDSDYGGEWTIRDANGTWQCEASCSSGDCTGSCNNGAETLSW